MKKIVVFMVLIVACATNGNGQTYCYKYLYHVDKKTGVKDKKYIDGSVDYYTFSNNKNYCCKSDKDGIKCKYHNPTYRPGIWESGHYEYTKVRANNSTITYKETIVTHMGYDIYTRKERTEEHYRYLIFSDDYKRANIDYGNSVAVYEKTTMPGQEAPPSQMW